MPARQASVERNTKETQIKVSVNLDGTGKFSMKSGLPFLEHMLEQVARHGLIDLAYIPLDEALSRVVIDFSGRPGLEYHIPFTRGTVGEFDVDLFHEFFQGFVNHAKVTLHIDTLRGNNAHHQIETVFKAFGRAVRMAMEADPRMQGTVPSTKGTLSG